MTSNAEPGRASGKSSWRMCEADAAEVVLRDDDDDDDVDERSSSDSSLLG